MPNFDIHRREKGLENLLLILKKLKDVNKTTLEKYYDYLCANGLSIARRKKEIRILLNLSKWLKKDFKKAKKNDLIKLVQTIEKQGYAEWTKTDYRIILKKFYSWLRGCERKTYPEEVRWIKTSYKNKNHKLPEELLTEDEIKKMVNAAKHPRNKALIMALAESGARINEIASLAIRNLQFDKYGCVIIVSGKTGDRRIRLIASAPLLASWVDIHPNKDDLDSPLWIGFGKRNNKDVITYNGISNMIKRVAKKAGIKKRIYCHLFRHSRATFLAKHLTESQLKSVFGWTQSSDMAATYVHLSGRDTDDAILKLHGLKKSKEVEESKLKPIKCPRCKFVNSPTSDFCSRCAMALNLKAVMKLENKRVKYDDELNLLAKYKPEELVKLGKLLARLKFGKVKK